uniref:Uncharacterized protein n=1 Tax=Syphacia muris TaxID=451379 RepID=A0A0N5ACU6_9BILA
MLKSIGEKIMLQISFIGLYLTLQLNIISVYSQGTDEGFINKNVLRLQAKEMFLHGYYAYMKNAYPHDELMPLSCKGRQRGVTPSRGDVDDSLGK